LLILSCLPCSRESSRRGVYKEKGVFGRDCIRGITEYFLNFVIIGENVIKTQNKVAEKVAGMGLWDKLMETFSEAPEWKGKRFEQFVNLINSIQN